MHIKRRATTHSISSVLWSHVSRNGIISRIKKHEIKYKNFVGLSLIIL